MTTYTIRHEEMLVGYFYIDADSEDDAMKKYDKKCNDGEIDFSDLDVIYSLDTIDG